MIRNKDVLKIGILLILCRILPTLISKTLRVVINLRATKQLSSQKRYIVYLFRCSKAISCNEDMS